jgi:hypothetical protein
VKPDDLEWPPQALAMFSGNFIFIFAELERLRSFQFCLFTQGVAKVSGRSRFYCLCRFGLSGENAFGAARVCVAMKAPVGLLSGERSASADGGALPRQVPQAATNAKKKIWIPLNIARAKAEAI